MCILSLFAGMGRAFPAAHPSLPPEGKYIVSARVSGESEMRAEDGRVKTLLRQVEAADEAGNRYRLPGAYWTFYPPEEEPLPLDGKRAFFETTLYHPSGQENPRGFDFRMYLLQKGITAGLSGARDLRLAPEGQTVPQSFWMRARQSIGAMFDAMLGDQGAMAKALIIGDRADLKEETTKSFQIAGVAHVLSVSGLHVGLLMLIVMFILGRFSLSPRTRLFIVAFFLLLYCRLLDFTAPVVRASILTVMLLLGRCFRRRADPLTSLAASFVIVLLLRPLDLLNVGFQLSFLAVLGIITLGAQLSALFAAFSEGRKLPAPCVRAAQAYATTLSASAFTAIPTIAAFHRLSVIGLLLGPAACAVVGVLMAAYLALIPFGLLYMPLAQALSVPVSLLSRSFSAGMAYFASLPWASVQLPSPAAVSVAAGYLCLLMCTRYTLLSWWKRAVACALAVLLATLIVRIQGNVHARYIQLSAGKADTAVIEDGGTTFVIDAGEHGGDLSSYLLGEGRDIDTLFITHLHFDHVGGLRQLMDSQVVIREIALPYGAFDALLSDDSLQLIREAQAKGIPLRSLAEGDTLSSGRVGMRVLWPFDGRLYPGMDANHGSLVMLWDFQGVTLMTAGDLTGEYELYAAQPAHILKTAHHGSKYATSAAFLDIVAPQIAIITVSDTAAERAAAAAQRLSEAGSETFFTNESGAVIITFKPNALEITEFCGGRDSHEH